MFKVVVNALIRSIALGLIITIGITWLIENIFGVGVIRGENANYLGIAVFSIVGLITIYSFYKFLKSNYSIYQKRGYL